MLLVSVKRNSEMEVKVYQNVFAAAFGQVFAKFCFLSFEFAFAFNSNFYKVRSATHSTQDGALLLAEMERWNENKIKTWISSCIIRQFSPLFFCQILYHVMTFSFWANKCFFPDFWIEDFQAHLSINACSARYLSDSIDFCKI